MLRAVYTPGGLAKPPLPKNPPAHPTESLGKGAEPKVWVGQVWNEWANKQYFTVAITDAMKQIAYNFAEAYAAALASPQATQPYWDKKFDEHVGHVQEFLQEMFAVMVDPLDQPPMTINEMCIVLLATAKEQRQKFYEMASSSPRPLGNDLLAKICDCIDSITGPTGGWLDSPKQLKAWMKQFHVDQPSAPLVSETPQKNAAGEQLYPAVPGIAESWPEAKAQMRPGSSTPASTPTELIKDLLGELDGIARAHDIYDYGLPLGHETREPEMIAAVNEWLEKLASVRAASESAERELSSLRKRVKELEARPEITFGGNRKESL